jgi:hypothetical protein
MGEHVVHLSGEPLAFGQSSRPCLPGPGALQFDQKPFGLVVGLPEPSREQRHAGEADDRDSAKQRRGRRVVADGHRGRRKAHDPGDRQRDREAIWHPWREQHQARQEPGQARSVRLQPHQRRRTGQEHYCEDDADCRAAVAGCQRAQRAKHDTAHSENGGHVVAWQPRIPAAGEHNYCYHGKDRRSEAAHPPVGCLLLRPRPAQPGEGRAAHGVCAHLSNVTARRPQRHRLQGRWPGLTQGGYASTRR